MFWADCTAPQKLDFSHRYVVSPIFYNLNTDINTNTNTDTDTDTDTDTNTDTNHNTNLVKW